MGKVMARMSFLTIMLMLTVAILLVIAAGIKHTVQRSQAIRTEYTCVPYGDTIKHRTYSIVMTTCQQNSVLVEYLGLVGGYDYALTQRGGTVTVAGRQYRVSVAEPITLTEVRSP